MVRLVGEVRFGRASSEPAMLGPAVETAVRETRPSAPKVLMAWMVPAAISAAISATGSVPS